MTFDRFKKFLGFAKESLLPCKGDTRKYAVLKSVISVFLAASVVFTAASVGYFVKQDNEVKRLGQLSEIISSDSSADRSKAFKTLKKINPDLKYIISVDGADILQPVVESEKVGYFENHNFQGDLSRYGALCVEKNADRGKNTVIHGNNMADGEMLGRLGVFKKPKDYINSPFIELFDEKGAHPYIIFSVMLLASDPDDDNGGFDITKNNFKKYAEFSRWRDEAEERSFIDVGIKPQMDDEIICLVTDSNEFKGARLAVLAFSLSKDSEVDSIRETYLNVGARRPKIWYEKNGYEYPSKYNKK